MVLQYKINCLEEKIDKIYEQAIKDRNENNNRFNKVYIDTYDMIKNIINEDKKQTSHEEIDKEEVAINKNDLLDILDLSKKLQCEMIEYNYISSKIVYKIHDKIYELIFKEK